MKVYKLKSDRIYLPKGISEWRGINQQLTALKITITSGGGIGGSRWTRFIKPQKIKDGLNWVEQVDGEDICINTNYIVEIEKVQLIMAEYICTNPNFNMRNELCYVYVSVPIGIDVKLVNDVKLIEEWTNGFDEL